MLDEMHPLPAPCPYCHSFSMPLTRGTPRIRERPTIFLHASAHFSFASVSQSSYRNWNAVVAPFSLSLPWHPFSFHHGDKCLIMLLSTFNKKLHKLVHVIRIMITTIKMFKIVVALKFAKCMWGFTGFVVCYIRPHLNCLDR